MISASLRCVFTIRVVARTEAVATFASYRYILYHNLCYSHSQVSQGEDLRAKKMYIVTIFPVQEWDQIHSFPSKSASPAPPSLSVVLKPATFSSSALPAPFSCHLSLSICFTVIHAPPPPPSSTTHPPSHSTQPHSLYSAPIYIEGVWTASWWRVGELWFVISSPQCEDLHQRTDTSLTLWL